MKKNAIALILLLFVLLLAACQDDPPQPEATEEPKPQPVQVSEDQTAAEARLVEYIALWTKGDFQNMYANYLNEGTKGAFGEVVFIDWQRQLQEELNIQNVKVAHTPAENADWNKDQPADFNLAIAMETGGGPVEFNKTMSLLYENEDWFVEWDPSFIVPGLEEGDKVSSSKALPPRGEIIDRQKKPLAFNAAGYEVGVIPEKFDRKARTNDLAILLGMTPEAINEKLDQSWVQPHHYVPLAHIKEDQVVLDKLFAMTGTVREEKTMRSYPFGGPLSHITGFIGPITAEQLAAFPGYQRDDVIGRRGLEELFEDRLRGTAGGRIIIQKANGGGNVTAAEREPAQGEAVHLSIDAGLQKRLYTAMGGKPGAAAAVDPKTGEVFALVSSPGYNPNDFIPNITASRYQKLASDPRLVFFNRFAAAYTPGAALNPVVAAAGLKAETIKADAINKTLNATPHNAYAAAIKAQGIDAFKANLTAFGFGEPLPFAIELTPSQLSVDGVPGSAGQVQANILHLASAYTAFLNEGIIYEPALLFGQEPKVWKEGLVTKEGAESMQAALKTALAKTKLGQAGIAGTLSTVKASGKENGVFVGYDTGNPAYVIALIVEDTDKKTLEAAVLAAFNK